MKKPYYLSLLFVLFLAAGLYSCERLGEIYRWSEMDGTKIGKGSDHTGDEKPSDPCGEPVIIPLVSRDNTQYSPGHLTVTNDDQFLNVKFEVTEEGVNIDMMYLFVGPLHLVPLDETGSYPAFWDFDHQYADVPVESYTYSLSLADLEDCFNIIAQARFVDGQGNITVTWTDGTNPDWSQGPFYTYYCAEVCDGNATDTAPAWKQRIYHHDDHDHDSDDGHDDDKDD